MLCHPERREGSRYTITTFQILRFTQNDKTFLPFHFETTSYKLKAYFLMYLNKASR